MRKFKSPWYYWHTGHKVIALSSLTLSTLILWAVLGVSAGFSPWGILLALLLDAAGFWLALLYLLVLRPYVPAFSGLQEQVDALIIYQFAVPMLLGFLLNRASSFLVARLSGYRFN